MKAFRLAAAISLVAGATIARADVVLDFGTGTGLNSLGYTEDGMKVISVSGTVLPRIRDWPANSSPATGTESGEREMLFNLGDGTIRFALISGGLFDLISFDVENPAGVIGYSAGGLGVVSGSTGWNQGFQGDDFGTQFTPNFTNLSYFDVFTVNGQHTIDNIRFAPVIASVPEPTSLALVGLALAGAALSRRRSK